MKFIITESQFEFLKNILLEEEPSPCVVSQKCKDDYESALKSAVTYWKEWISAPATKEKFIKNYIEYKRKDIADRQTEIFEQYIAQLDSLKLFPVSFSCEEPKFPDGAKMDTKKMGDNIFAFVMLRKKYKDYVFVNCDNSDKDDDKVASMIHEIQHSLFRFVMPLNPLEKVESLFVGQGTKKSKLSNIFSFKKNKGSVDPNISKENIKKLFPQDFEQIYSYWEDLKTNNDLEYACRLTEKGSNISKMRYMFNKKPGEDITVEELTPYVKGDKWNDDIVYFLLCWAVKGYGPFEELLKTTNEFAKVQTQNKNLSV